MESRPIQEHSITLADLNIRSVEEFNSRFRGTAPTALICPIPHLKHTSVVLLAPLCTLFCAERFYPEFSASLHDYTYSRLVRDPRFYEDFQSALGEVGLSPERLTRQVFAPYAQFGGYGREGNLSPLGRRSPIGLALDRRVETAFVPDSLTGIVLSHWKNQLRAFGNRSILKLDREVEALTSKTTEGLDEISSRPEFTSSDRVALCTNRFIDEKTEAIAMDRLRSILDNLRKGSPTDLNLFPGEVVKMMPSLWIPPDGPSRLACERLALRAEALLRLGWVWHVAGAVGSLEVLTERLESVDTSYRGSVEEAMANIRLYLQTMADRYPVILEDPMENLVNAPAV